MNHTSMSPSSSTSSALDGESNNSISSAHPEHEDKNQGAPSASAPDTPTTLKPTNGEEAGDRQLASPIQDKDLKQKQHQPPLYSTASDKKDVAQVQPDEAWIFSADHPKGGFIPGTDMERGVIVQEGMGRDHAQEDISIDDSDFGPPDGGLQAWLVVFASFMVHFVVLGTLYSFGVYNSYFIAQNLGPSSVVSFIGTVGAALFTAFGLLSGRLAERFGFQRMIFIGSIILSCGLLLASFSTALWQLFLTQGFLYGLGSSISYFPAVSIPSQYFDKYRGLATGIAVSGSGIGGLVFAIASQKLLDSVGFAWSMRINALVSFVCIAAVTPLFKTRIPPAPHSKTDLTVFKDIRFLLLIGTGLFATFANLVPPYFLPQFALERLGTPLKTGAVLLSIYNGSSAVGRVVLGISADQYLGRLNSLVLCMFVSASSMLVLWQVSSTFGILIAFAIINGFVAGGFISLFPVTLAHIFGVERLPSLIGTIFSISSLGNLAGAPLAGAIKDAAGFSAAIWYAGGVTAVSFVFITAVRFIVEKKVFVRA